MNSKNDNSNLKKTIDKQINEHEVKLDSSSDNKNEAPNKNGDDSQKMTNILNDEIKMLNNKLEEKDNQIKLLEAKINEYNNNYLNEINKKTLEAEQILKNKVNEYQQKFESEIAHIKKYALKDKVLDLINVINNFEMALNSSPTDPAVKNYVDGFKMFANMFQNYLSNSGIIAIIPKIGDEYDSKTMDAIDTEVTKQFKTHSVVKVVKKGYKLHDVVILPATVIVAK